MVISTLSLAIQLFGVDLPPGCRSGNISSISVSLNVTLWIWGLKLSPENSIKDILKTDKSHFWSNFKLKGINKLSRRAFFVCWKMQHPPHATQSPQKAKNNGLEKLPSFSPGQSFKNPLGNFFSKGCLHEKFSDGGRKPRVSPIRGQFGNFLASEGGIWSGRQRTKAQSRPNLAPVRGIRKTPVTQPPDKISKIPLF